MISLLRRRFADIRRAADAAEAFCLIEQREFAATLGLVIASHGMTGIGGPAFVAEVRSRMPEVPILVLGAENESAAEFQDQRIKFLPRSRAAEQALMVAAQLLAREKHAAV